jgi:four helix bundle protein
MRRNPKSENRSPKEGRKPKPELYRVRAPEKFRPTSAGGIPAKEPAFEDIAGSWGDEDLTLREDRPASEYDLIERSAVFGERIIRLAKKIPQNPVNNRLIDQLVGSGTSIGANYCEADDAVSGKDFKQRVGTCRKESKEAMFFLRMMATAEESLAQEARVLWHEAKELNLIFGAIWRK